MKAQNVKKKQIIFDYFECNRSYFLGEFVAHKSLLMVWAQLISLKDTNHHK